MTQSKLMTLAEAISRFVSDGSSIALGTAQETLIPFAAGHEIIRQRKQSLILIGPISDILFDQMIGAGCVKKVQAGWVGNVITGSGYNFRQAVESGELEMEDHSNLTLAMGLRAGALGVPFLPTYTALGSDLRLTNHNLKTVTCPFTGRNLTAVAAIQPDIAIVHVQKSDIYGNAHAWGNLGVTKEACQAARRVILTCEEIVSSDLIRRDPNRVVVPGLRVAAVVQAPWGAHPSPVPGYYNRDHEAFISYQQASKSPQAFADWQRRWIDEVQGPDDYLDLIGTEKRNQLKLKFQAPSGTVDYGY